MYVSKLYDMHVPYNRMIHIYYYSLCINHCTEKVVLKCCQNGKTLSAEVKDLSREDCLPLSTEDFKRGAQLLVEHKGKFYPVEFISFKGIMY